MLIDISRVAAGNGKAARTFCRQGTFPYMFGKGRTRIDAVFLNRAALSLWGSLANVTSLPGMGSDHVLLVFDICISEIKPTALYWQCPTMFPVHLLPDIPECDGLRLVTQAVGFFFLNLWKL